MDRYGEIISRIQERLPRAEINMMAYYPVNETEKLSDDEWVKTAFVTRTNENILIANQAVEKLAGLPFPERESGSYRREGKTQKGIYH